MNSAILSDVILLTMNHLPLIEKLNQKLISNIGINDRSNNSKRNL